MAPLAPSSASSESQMLPLLLVVLGQMGLCVTAMMSRLSFQPASSIGYQNGAACLLGCALLCRRKEFSQTLSVLYGSVCFLGLVWVVLYGYVVFCPGQLHLRIEWLLFGALPTRQSLQLSSIAVSLPALHAFATLAGAVIGYRLHVEASSGSAEEKRPLLPSYASAADGAAFWTPPVAQPCGLVAEESRPRSSYYGGHQGSNSRAADTKQRHQGSESRPSRPRREDRDDRAAMPAQPFRAILSAVPPKAFAKRERKDWSSSGGSTPSLPSTSSSLADSLLSSMDETPFRSVLSGPLPGAGEVADDEATKKTGGQGSLQLLGGSLAQAARGRANDAGPPSPATTDTESVL